MLYNAPYGSPGGPNDTTAHYINGNPSTGTMGSIPPAASIENPQREIVNFIGDSGLTATDTDLHQVSKGVQSGAVTYAVDFGIANSYIIDVVPPLTAYVAGQRWGVKIKNTNTGASTLNINSIGPRNIIYPSGGALTGNEMTAGAVVTLVDDGAHLQLQNVVNNLLSAPLFYYVNATTGSDTTYDGTQPTVSGTKGPFATIGRAITAAHSWNQNGFAVDIFVADGIYPPFSLTQPINGSGSIGISGDKANPAGVLIHSTAGEAILAEANGYFVSGLTVQSDSVGVAPQLGCGIRVLGCTLNIQNINFGACVTAQLLVQSSGNVGITGVEDGNPGDFIQVSGDSPAHLQCTQNSFIELGQCDMKITGTRNIGCWASVQANAVISSYYRTITGAPGVTGQKYNASLNGVINTSGQGASYFPGTVAGATTTGGQYA